MRSRAISTSGLGVTHAGALRSPRQGQTTTRGTVQERPRQLALLEGTRQELYSIIQATAGLRTGFRGDARELVSRAAVLEEAGGPTRSAIDRVGGSAAAEAVSQARGTPGPGLEEFGALGCRPGEAKRR